MSSIPWHVMFTVWWAALHGIWLVYDEQHSMAYDVYCMMSSIHWHVIFSLWWTAPSTPHNVMLTSWWAVLGIAHESFMHISKLATVEMITFHPLYVLRPPCHRNLTASAVFWFLKVGINWLTLKNVKAIRTLQFHLLIWFLHFLSMIVLNLNHFTSKCSSLRLAN
jgi:hypothetical protein